jgi:hypothetical protein
MFDFFVRIFIKSPIGFIVLGILVSVTIGPAVYNLDRSPSWIVIGIIISVIGVIRLIVKIRRNQRVNDSPDSSGSGEGANDLFIELNKGSTLTIKDDYICDPNGFKLGSIIGSGVHSRGRQIGNIKGNEVIGLDGNLICRIENGCLVK